MLKFGNKGEASVAYKCTIRLLDDSEVIECEFQVSDVAVKNLAVRPTPISCGFWLRLLACYPAAISYVGVILVKNIFAKVRVESFYKISIFQDERHLFFYQ